jgi:hypothetical protein
MKNFIEIGQHYINFQNITFVEIKAGKCIIHFTGGEHIEAGVSLDSFRHALMNRQ